MEPMERRALLAAAAAAAGTVTISGDSSGIFENPSPPAGSYTGLGTSSFTWGEGNPGALGFAGASIAAAPEQTFAFGTLTYFNGTTSGGEADSVQLAVTVNLDDLGPKTFSYNLFIVNSPNTEDPVASADSIQLSLPAFPTQTFVSPDGDELTLELLGFGQSTGQGFQTIDKFFVLEGGTASAQVLGRFTAPPDDLIISGARLEPALPGVSFSYEFQGDEPEPFTIGLYRSSDEVFDPGVDVQLDSKQVQPAEANEPFDDLFAFSQPLAADPDRPFVLVVADPSDAVVEANDDNNTAAVSLPRLQLVDPAADTTFWISDVPAMPVITAHVQVAGLQSDPTAQTQFQWTTKIRLPADHCPNGVEVVADDIMATVTGGEYTPQFGQLRGGELTFIVEATVAGVKLKVESEGLFIGGRNPTEDAIRQALGDDTLRRIARQESGMRQFRPDGCPLFSGDNLGGAGIMQITPANPDQIWNWRENVAAGIRKIQETRRVARQYPARVQRSAAFRAEITALNQQRRAQGLRPIHVDVPQFTADQIERDAIRGYNGYAGRDAFGNVLHEYRLARNADGSLQLVIDPRNGQAQAVWEQVPVADRPQNVGDPDYVNHVLAQAP